MDVPRERNPRVCRLLFVSITLVKLILKLIDFCYRIQNMRMELLKKMLKTREENQASILAKKLDRLWAKKQKEKDHKIKKLRAENIKSRFNY